MSGGYNFDQTSKPGFTFGGTPTSAATTPSTGAFSFVAPATSGAGGGPAFSFGNTTTTTAAPTGGSFFGGQPPTPPVASMTVPAASVPAFGPTVSSGFGGFSGHGGLSFGAPQSTTDGGTFSFSTPATTAAVPAGASFVGGPSQTSQAQMQPRAPPAASTAVAATSGLGGFSFPTGGSSLGAPAKSTASGGASPFGALRTTAASPAGGGFFDTSKASQMQPHAQPVGTTAAGSSFFGGGAFKTPSAAPLQAPAVVRAASPSAGLSMGGGMFGGANVQATAAFTASPASTATSLAAQPAGSSGFSGFPSKTSSAAAQSTQASSTNPSGAFSFGTTTTSSTSPSGAFSFGTNASTGNLLSHKPPAASDSSTTVMTYALLEDLINKWSIELEDQERLFHEQATKVNDWDCMLMKNGEIITSQHKEIEKLKLDQRRLNQELDFILSQQNELEDMLSPLETSMKEQGSRTMYMQNADVEREKTYKLAENIDAQLKKMSQDLREIIEHLNTSYGPADTSDPLNQICKILNAHLDSLQWIDQNAALLQRRVEDVSKVSK